MRRPEVKEFIARWEVPFGIFTVVLYGLAIVLVAVVFPDVSNLWVSLFVLFGGFTSSMMALASVLKTRE